MKRSNHPDSTTDSLERHVEVAIIGGGIVGLATAFQLHERRLASPIAVLEKETSLALHQSGRNSGVLHSGLYYPPGSLKAQTCREGKQRLEAFCRSENIPLHRTGKVIVATNEAECARLDFLLERGRANGVVCERIGPHRLREIEPHAAGKGAIHVPEAGVVDFAAVCRRLAELLEQAGHEVARHCELLDAQRDGERIRLRTSRGDLLADRVINTAGLHADRMAQRLTGRPPRTRIVPFRGEYYELCGASAGLCRGLIYPVPDPRYPFLGVHVTRTVGGLVECGPNAVLALAREGYRKGRTNLGELMRLAATPGLATLLRRHLGTGLAELYRSYSKRAFAHAVQRLLPEVNPKDLRPLPSGVRAQALEADGRLVDDFRLVREGNVVNVLNAPSPAATASFAIGRRVVETLVS